MTTSTDYARSMELQDAMAKLATGWDMEQDLDNRDKISRYEKSNFRNKPNKNKKLHRALIECKKYGY